MIMLQIFKSFPLANNLILAACSFMVAVHVAEISRGVSAQFREIERSSRKEIAFVSVKAETIKPVRQRMQLSSVSFSPQFVLKKASVHCWCLSVQCLEIVFVAYAWLPRDT
jgi:hypothetical protein